MTGLADVADGHGGRWLSLAEAAVALDYSERTIRRALATGRYQKRRVHGRLQVLVPSLAMADNGVTARVDVAEPADSGDTVGSGASGRLDRADLPDTMRRRTRWRALECILGRQTGAADRERERVSDAEETAAMWQERARTLEVVWQRVLALPTHEEPDRRRHGWQWRRG